MSKLLKQSSTAQPLTFFLVLSTDGKTAATGITPTVKLSKSGGTGVSPSGSVSEVDSTNCPGLYKIAGNATDTNTLGPLWLHATGSGCDPADKEFEVVAFDPQSATNLGLSNIDATTSSRSAPATAQTIDQTTAVPTNPTPGTLAEAFLMAMIRKGRRNTAQTGSTASTIKLDAAASAVDSTYANDLVIIVAGTGAGQTRTATGGYSGTTKVLPITPNWTTTPDNTSVFQTVPQPLVELLTPVSIPVPPTVTQIRQEMDSNSTQLAKLGAFTATGVNTILGFFKALFSKAATLPSDIGGTFDPATDSVEAISEAIASGSGSLTTEEHDALLAAATQTSLDDATNLIRTLPTAGQAADQAAKVDALYAVKTAYPIATAPDGSVTGAGGGGGATAEEIWSYGDRLLTDNRIVSVPAQQYGQRSIIRGNNYGVTGRSLLVTINAGAEWPADLSTLTWTLTAEKHPDNENDGSASITGTASVFQATGDSRALRVTLSATTTAGMAIGLYKHSLRGIATGGVAWTIELGLIDVKEDPAVA